MDVGSVDENTYISVEFGERVVHIKSVHVNNGSIYCELRTGHVLVKERVT